MMRMLTGGRLLAVALVAIVVTGLSLPSTSSAQTADVTFRVTVTNATNPEMVVTPGAVVAHDAADAFWSEGAAAGLALERIAEIGDSSEAEGTLGAVAIGAAPAAGDTVSVDVVASPGSLLSTAQMLVATNDAFVGVNSLPLWSDGQPTRATIPLVAWDAGTEDNAALFAGFDAGQPDPAMGAANVDNGTATVDGVVALSDQFTGVQAWLTVTPLATTVGVDAGLSLIGWTGAATTSTALLAANPNIEIVWFWDGAAWQSDTENLPAALRTEIAINFGDAMFVVTSGATEIAVPLV